LFIALTPISLVVSYIKHQLRAGNAHSIHSPFVFDLYTQAIRPQSDSDFDLVEVEDLRNRLRKDTTEIEVLDLGAGSRINKSNRRKISDISRNAEKPARFGRLFYRLAQKLNPQNIVELGTSLGITTAYFAKAVPEASIVTLEGCPETARIARQNFEQLGLNSIDTIVGNIDETLSEQLAKLDGEVDMVFFDANHRLEPTVRYFEEAKKYAGSHTVFIFDDIYWSEEMTQAWEFIKAQPDVTVTVDLFWLGLVFFRKEQRKENFILRF
jgi:predicted O-methyltransferase YrrM